MSVGFTVNKADLDNRAGSIAVDLRNVMDRIRVFKVKLDTLTDGDLTSAPIGYSVAEKDQLRSAFVDAEKLRTVYAGTATQGTTYNFETFLKLLTGCV